MDRRGRAEAVGSAMVGIIGLLAVAAPRRPPDTMPGRWSTAGRSRARCATSARRRRAATLEVTKDTAVCGATAKLATDLVVGPSGGLQYAVVSLRGIAAGKPFDPAPPTLDQRGCEYAPHVIIVPAGRELTILNSDGVLHNIHTASLHPDAAANPTVNRAQPKFKTSMTETFSAPEILRATCDVHGWMKGWIVVADHPYYAVTDAQGRFALSDVPPGDYQLHVWHETLGELTQPVSVAPGATTTVAAEMGPR